MEKKSNRSESLNELFGALAKAQAEMQVAELSSANPFFKSKYADFTTIVKASRPALTKNGLCVIQQILPNDAFGVLHTILGHSSGQYIESQVDIKPIKADVQSLGSYITYLKRYSYTALVGITTGDEDDDGEAAMSRESKPQAKSQPAPVIEEDCIEKHDEEFLRDALNGFPEMAEDILKKLNYDSLSQIKKSEFKRVLNHVIKKKAELNK